MKKRFLYFGLAALVLGGGGYIYLHREDLGILKTLGLVKGSAADSSVTAEWRPVDRSSDGFRVDLPGEFKLLHPPAYNEAGSSEPIDMILASPENGVTYSVAWAENPPVVRVNNRVSDKLLDMAREDALVRTQTSLVNESHTSPEGYPGRDFVGRNTGGGVMECRLIYTGQKLYMLTAAFPSSSTRSERDVQRFFKSFTLAVSSSIPSTLPPAERN